MCYVMMADLRVVMQSRQMYELCRERVELFVVVICVLFFYACVC